MTINTENTIYDCIVVGGGISGISFAHYMKKAGKNVLIIEKDNKIGGQLNTIHSVNKPDFWCELGSHTCYNSYTNLLAIAKEVGEGYNELQPLDKFNYVLYRSGKISSIFSAISPISFMINAFKIFSSKKDGKSVREYFRPIVGKSNYDKLFKYAFRAVICQDADNYPAEMFLKRRKQKEKELSRRFTFKKGLHSFLSHIIEKDGLSVIKSTQITGLGKSEGIYSLKANDGSVFRASSVALASNPFSTSILLKDIEPEVAELLSSISLFHSQSVNVIIPEEKLSHLKKVAGIISCSDNFMSAVSRDLVADDSLRGFTFHFEKDKLTKEEQFNLICKVLGISLSDILEHYYTEHMLPSVGVEHVGLEEKIDQARINDNVYILGNYFYGLSLEDCVNRSLNESKRIM